MPTPVIGYWFAVISPSNFEILRTIDFSYYAVGERSLRVIERVKPGDGVVLYRSGKSGGVVGAFKTIAHVELNPDTTLFSTAVYPYRVAWQSIITVESAVPMQPIVSALSFVANKQNYGSALQGSLRSIPFADYRVLLGALSSASQSR